MKQLFFLFTLNLLFIYNVFSQDTINQLDSLGKKKGYWRVLHENGKIRYEGFFINGDPVGEIKRYYTGGILQANLNYKQNSPEAYAKLYYENGELAAEGKYFDKQKDSTWNYYSSYDGHLTLKENYRLGSREGESIKMYNNDVISERMIFQHDKRNGIWEQYYQNGSPRLKGYYINDKREGEFISWTDTGKLSIKGNYKDGLMHGKWLYFDEDGELEITVEYNQGTMIPNKEMEKRQEEFSKRIQESIGDFKEPEMPF